jgi:hypothetical protein
MSLGGTDHEVGRTEFGRNLGGVFDFFAGLLEFSRIAWNRVEKVDMVSVVAASAKTTE